MASYIASFRNNTLIMVVTATNVISEYEHLFSPGMYQHFGVTIPTMLMRDKFLCVGVKGRPELSKSLYSPAGEINLVQQYSLGK